MPAIALGKTYGLHVSWSGATYRHPGEPAQTSARAASIQLARGGQLGNVRSHLSYRALVLPVRRRKSAEGTSTEPFASHDATPYADEHVDARARKACR